MQKDHSRGLLVAAALGLLLSMLFVLDGLNALGEQACLSPGAGPDCYPWGTEGPSAGRWSYQSKANYLFTAFVPGLFALAVLAGGSWAFVRKRNVSRRAFLACIGIMAGGYVLPTLIGAVAG